MEKIEIIIGVIVAVLAFFGVATTFINKLKKELLEAIDKGIKAGKKIEEIRSVGSKGGKKITIEEIEETMPILLEVMKEIVDVFEVMKDALEKRKKK